MKKVFISQPMAGKTKEEILEARRDAIKQAEEKVGEQLELIDSFIEEEVANPLECLGESIKRMAQADLAVFVDGWRDARGCCEEYSCAVNYGIDVLDMHVDKWNFSVALNALKRGKRMTRADWKGKGLFVVCQKGYPEGIPCNKQTAEAWGMEEGELFRCDPYLQINTTDGNHAMWVPSIRDLMAEDWMFVDEQQKEPLNMMSGGGD